MNIVRTPQPRRSLIKAIICWFSGHKWTCAADKGIKPTPKQLRSLAGFSEYSTTYCDRCGRVSEDFRNPLI